MSQLLISEFRAKDDELQYDYIYKGQSFPRGFKFFNDIKIDKFADDEVFARLAHYLMISDATCVFGLDYYDEIKVDFYLDDEEIKFLEKSIFYGMAEFRYCNGIDIHKKTKIIQKKQSKVYDKLNLYKPIKNSALLLNGGGKDGLVAYEITKHLDISIDMFSLGDIEAHRAIPRLTKTNFIYAKKISNDYAKKNKTVFGHKPLSFYVAMVSTLVAYVTNKQYVISANEFSANFANIIKDGVAVNHQYTKSMEFETEMADLFNKKKVPVQYFSITRQLYELQVMKIFAHFEKYHDKFLSCNEGIKEGRWCMVCPKCAFIMGSLYLFNPKSAMKVWGDSKKVFTSVLTDELIELTNPNLKPFECIGTVEENRYLVDKLIKLGLVNLNKEQKNRFNQYMKSFSSDFDLTSLRGTSMAPSVYKDKLHKYLLKLLGDKL